MFSPELSERVVPKYFFAFDPGAWLESPVVDTVLCPGEAVVVEFVGFMVMVDKAFEFSCREDVAESVDLLDEVDDRLSLRLDWSTGHCEIVVDFPKDLGMAWCVYDGEYAVNVAIARTLPDGSTSSLTLEMTVKDAIAILERHGIREEDVTWDTDGWYALYVGVEKTLVYDCPERVVAR